MEGTVDVEFGAERLTTLLGFVVLGVFEVVELVVEGLDGFQFELVELQHAN